MKTIEDYNSEIEKANADYAAYEEKKQAELDAIAKRVQAIADEERLKKNEHQLKVETLQKERDAAALTEKLKSFPAKLVEGHKFCSVCKSAMRPFETVDGKFWACQVGSLQITHDLVQV
jgi:DNA repair exonuclease SbcCD ATPase subunit